MSYWGVERIGVDLLEIEAGWIAVDWIDLIMVDWIERVP